VQKGDEMEDKIAQQVVGRSIKNSHLPQDHEMSRVMIGFGR
jgi:hypothetical protein